MVRYIPRSKLVLGLVLVLLITAAWATAGPRPAAAPPPSGWLEFKGKTFTVMTTDNRSFRGTMADVRILDQDTYLFLRTSPQDVWVNTRHISVVKELL